MYEVYSTALERRFRQTGNVAKPPGRRQPRANLRPKGTVSRAIAAAESGRGCTKHSDGMPTITYRGVSPRPDRTMTFFRGWGARNRVDRVTIRASDAGVTEMMHCWLSRGLATGARRGG